MRAPRRENVATYGYTRVGQAWVARPTSLAELHDCLDFARSRGLSLCAAGGRNSFGDVFLLTDQLVVDLSGLACIERFDREKGVLVTGPGARIPDVLARIMPEGWFLTGLSGSLWNTVAGNLATNIHGKDSWRDGNFVRNVRSFRLLGADGEEVEVSREARPELFAAAVGGLGLLGLVTQVTLELRPIASLRVRRCSRRVAGLAEMLKGFEELDPARTDFAYGWVDAFAVGNALGRGVFETARFVEEPRDPAQAAFERGLIPPERVAFLRPESFWSVYRTCWDALVALRAEKLFHRSMNWIKYARARSDGGDAEPVPFPDFQYPMVKLLSHWRDKFRPHGFHEIQSLFPHEVAPKAFRALLGVCRHFDVVPEVCSIRGHRDDPTLLSFKGDGLSMTVNHPLKHFPAGRRAAFTERLLATILDHGGRIYLAKHPWIPREAFRRMYPEAERFRALKSELDPERLFWSDAAEHLFGPEAE